MLLKISYLLLLPIILPLVAGHRILLLTALGSKSHKIFYMGIVEALAARGHEVTVVSAYKEAKEIPNIREIIVDFDLHEIVSDAFHGSPLKNVIHKSPMICSDTLAQKVVQDLKKEKFDLILISFFMNFCYLSFVHHLKVPFIYLSSAGLLQPFTNVAGNIDFPSIIPHKLLYAEFPLSFTQRFASTVLNTIMFGALNFYVLPKTERICKERGLCPEEMSLSEIAHNSSFTIVNSIRTIETPFPTFPNIIFAGGAHIKRTVQPLPKEMENWVAESGKEGFIFFSLGSALNPSVMPEKYRKILVNVFGSLNTRVLWKWSEENMPDLPQNVMLKKWFPQRDILGHPKLRLFITHGGISSVQEAAYNGVPIIGMPVFVDQFSNVKEAELEGWGSSATWEDLEEESLRKLIIDTLNDTRKLDIVKQKSDRMRDRLMPPDEEAAYWVEYTIRHNGAPHMMSPAIHMSWVTIYNIDVWAFIAGIFLGIFYLLYRLLKFLFKLCFAVKKQKKKNE